MRPGQTSAVRLTTGRTDRDCRSQWWRNWGPMTLLLGGSSHSKPSRTMLGRAFSFARGLSAAIAIVAAAATLGTAARAQSVDGQPVDKKTAPGIPTASPADEYSVIQRTVSGPAGNPECVWLGRRVVSLIWRDDIDTAFRHLDLYDRFGCPAARIQATFRCLVQHEASIDPKAPDSLNSRVEACWINPTQPAPAPAAAAAAPKQTTDR